jgi:hypothetical protein
MRINERVRSFTSSLANFALGPSFAPCEHESNRSQLVSRRLVSDEFRVGIVWYTWLEQSRDAKTNLVNRRDSLLAPAQAWSDGAKDGLQNVSVIGYTQLVRDRQ